MFDPRPYLDLLENACDLAHVQAAEARQLAAGRYEPLDRAPTIVSCHDTMRHIVYDAPPGWPRFPRSDTLVDPAKMLVAELTSAYEGALLKDDRAYTVRADYGAVIIPSVLGCAYVEPADDMPWLQHLPSREAVAQLLDAAVPDLRSGLGGKVLDTEAFFKETLAPYPKLAQLVHVGCADTQGPFNLAASIMGSDIFLAVVDEPDLVHRLLGRVTEVCIAFTRRHKETVGEAKSSCYQMGWCARGGARIVDDSATNLSGKMYREFGVPYNAKISEVFDGFMGHFCGRGKQILPAMLETPGIRALNFGNPEMQEWPVVRSLLKGAGVAALWDGDLPDDGEPVTTGVVHKRFCRSWQEAEQVAQTMREAHS